MFRLISFVALTMVPACSVWAVAPPARTPHSNEIRAFATIMAMAQTASDRCAEILVNNTMIDGAPTFFHITPADNEDYQLAAHLEMDRLAASVARAPTLKAWCDEAYRAYGQDGDVVKGLLRR